MLAVQVVEAGVLTNLPYANNSFDLVFSADVLEHIHEDEADAVVRELVRVSRRHLFLSISLKPHTKVRLPAHPFLRSAVCIVMPT
jgi:ubiquinone/menaquinone biosynthesis C-methylase UbiE